MKLEFLAGLISPMTGDLTRMAQVLHMTEQVPLGILGNGLAEILTDTPESGGSLHVGVAING